MKNCLVFLDNVGYRPQIYFQNNSKFKTFLGGVVTIFIAILTILATVSFGGDLYRRTNPTILLNKNFIEPAYNMSQINIIGYRLFYTGGIKIEELNRLVDIFMLHTVFDPKLAKSTLTRYEMIKCSQADIYKSNFLNLTSLIGNPDDYYCVPNNTTLFLKGKYGAPINNHMHLRIGICKNTTQNNNTCYPDEIIRKKMSSFFVSFIFKDSYIDGQDFENPVKYYITSNTLKSSAYTFRQDAYLFKDVTFKTDSGVILPDIFQQDYMQLDSISSGSTAESNTETFTNVIVGLTNLKDFYSRKYIKIQDVSAQVGGIIKFFLIFADLFISYYSYVPFLESLYESLFKYNIMEKDNNLKKSTKNYNEIHNSEANLVVPNLVYISKNKISDIIQEDKSKDVKDILKSKPFKSTINPRSHSCCEILYRGCLMQRKRNKFKFFSKIDNHYKDNFNVEKFFHNELNLTSLYEYTFNRKEQEIIQMYSAIKFFEPENPYTKIEANEEADIINSNIFQRLKIPKTFLYERIQDDSKIKKLEGDKQLDIIKFHQIKNRE